MRENVEQGTDLGVRAKGFMESGELVPDELVLDILFDRVSRPDCARGYVLDGFPRTLPQAEALDARLGPGVVPCVIDIAVSDEVVLRRLSGRLVCRKCGNIQHREHSPPAASGVCDACGGELQQRADDRSEVVRERLRVYHDQTAPLVQYYDSKGVLKTVDGDRRAELVFADVVRACAGGG